MKLFFIYIMLFNFSLSCFAQNFQLKIIGSTVLESKTIDSISYISKHKNIKSLNNEIEEVSQNLSKIGFIENQLIKNLKINDSSYIAELNLGKKIKSIYIYIGRKNTLNDLIQFNKTDDTLTLPYNEIEYFLNQTLQKLEQNGYAFANLKLINIQKKRQTLHADLDFNSGYRRQLNEIVIKYSESNRSNNFPKGALIQINKKYHRGIFNQGVLKQVHDDFEKFGFVSQIKYPEILFTKDTTKVYVYLKKKKSNTFDGYLGFNNNDNKKIALNGYLDLTLENTLQAGEIFSLYWKSDGKDQKVFNSSIDLPYLFKSPIGLKAQINIFKQDSTYQNTKTAINLGYLIDYNKRFYLGYQSTESSDIQNTNNSDLSDYENSFITSNFEYSKNDLTNSLFPKKTNLSFIFGIGKRTTNELAEIAGESKQYYIKLDAMHNFYLNDKNCINIKSQNYYLNSKTYLTNELFRFGGINSIRGFLENSLQASFMTSILTEYRYTISQNFYINTVLDYCLYKDPTNPIEKNNNNNLLSTGLGIGLQTKNGIFKLTIANGNTKEKEVKIYNTIIYICYNVKF